MDAPSSAPVVVIMVTVSRGFMRICILLHSNLRSGGNIAMLEHAQRLALKGHEVDVLLQERFFPSSVDYFRPDPAFTVGFLDEQPRSEPYDHVITNWWECAYRFEQLKSYSYGYFRHGDEAALYRDIGRFFDLSIDLVFQEALQFFVVSDALAQDLQRRGPIPTVLVPNGVDAERLRAAKPRLPPKVKALRVLVEGPVDAAHKRVRQTVEMLRSIDGVEIAHVAADGSGGDLPVDHSIGAVPYLEMGGVYASCDLLVKLSSQEAHPMPVFEAFGSGRSAVVSAFSGHERHILHGVNALVVPVGDDAAARWAVLRLRDDPSLLAALAQAASRSVDTLGWEAPSQRLEDALLMQSSQRSGQLATTPKLAQYRACYQAILHLWATTAAKRE